MDQYTFRQHHGHSLAGSFGYGLYDVFAVFTSVGLLFHLEGKELGP